MKSEDWKRCPEQPPKEGTLALIIYKEKSGKGVKDNMALAYYLDGAWEDDCRYYGKVLYYLPIELPKEIIGHEEGCKQRDE